MKIRIIIIALSILGQLGCSDEDDVNTFKDDASIKTLNGTWKVISFENYADNSVVLKSQENSSGLDIIVTFDDTEDVNKFSGTNTTNSLFGTFDYKETRKLEIISCGTTNVAQPVWADKFYEVLFDGGKLDFKINSTQLRLYYINKTKSVTLTKE